MHAIQDTTIKVANQYRPLDINHRVVDLARYAYRYGQGLIADNLYPHQKEEN